MEACANERNASVLAIAPRVQPRFDEVKAESRVGASVLAIAPRVQPRFDEVKAESRVGVSLLTHATAMRMSVACDD